MLKTNRQQGELLIYLKLVDFMLSAFFTHPPELRWQTRCPKDLQRTFLLSNAVLAEQDGELVDDERSFWLHLFAESDTPGSDWDVLSDGVCVLQNGSACRRGITC
jgi:hypothetical protein